MNTRSFIKSLALLSGAAAGCPGIFIPKFEPVRWKVAVNPDWFYDPNNIPLTNWAQSWIRGIDSMPYHLMTNAELGSTIADLKNGGNILL